MLAAARISQQQISLTVARRSGLGGLVDEYEAAAAQVRQLLGREPSELSGAVRPDADIAAEQTFEDAFARLRDARTALAAQAGALLPSASIAELMSFVQDVHDDLAYLVSTPVGGLRLDLRAGTGPDPQAARLDVRWLPDLTDDAVAEWVLRLHEETEPNTDVSEPDDGASHDPRPTSVRGASSGPSPAEVSAVLSEAGAALRTGPDRVGNGTDRVLRLVPVGLLALLPMPAAWPGRSAHPRGISVAGSGFLHLSARRNADHERFPGELRLAAVTDPRPCTWQGTRFPSLPCALQEGLMLEQDYDAKHRTGSAATADALATFLADESIDVIHVSAHGNTAADDPDLVALLLADGPTGESETWTIEDLPGRLGCRTLFLACCWLARTAARLPDEAVGFPTGLLQAGAASVIAPLWPVDDRATGEFVALFYLHRITYAQSAADAVATARAQLNVRAASDPSLSEIERARWQSTAAAFVLTGY